LYLTLKKGFGSFFVVKLWSYILKCRVTKQKKLLTLIAILLLASITLSACNQNRFGIVIDGDSMAPTMQHGDKYIVKKTTKVSCGDIIVFTLPENAKTTNLLHENDYIIKRVIGTAGDIITFVYISVGGYYDIFVNNTKLLEPYISEPTKSRGTAASYEVGEKQVFVMGDNRGGTLLSGEDSFDSRSFGNVPTANIKGVVGKKAK